MALKSLLLVGAAIAGLAIGAADAATFRTHTYDFTASGWSKDLEAADFNPVGLGGPSMHVEGDYYHMSGDSYIGSGAPQVEFNRRGLTSRNCDRISRIDCGRGEHTIDSRGPEGAEAMVFSFDQAVRLVNVTFSVSWGAGFDTFVGGSFLENSAFGGGTRNFASAGFSDSFAIGAKSRIRCFTTRTGREFCRDQASIFRIASITVEAADPSDPIAAQLPAVPLPAAGFMLIGGLGGFGILRRRRKFG